MLSKLFTTVSTSHSAERSDPQKQESANRETSNGPKSNRSFTNLKIKVQDKLSTLRKFIQCSWSEKISGLTTRSEQLSRIQENLEILCNQVLQLVQVGQQIHLRHGFMRGMKTQLLFIQDCALQIWITCVLIVQWYNNQTSRLLQLLQKHGCIINALKLTFIHQFTIISITVNDYHSQFLSFNRRVDRFKRPSWRYFPIELLILILLIGPVQSTSTCNSFPKIFGGSQSNTDLGQIDVYNDYLAIAGSTNDNSLTGVTTTSKIPYLALSSISIGSNYYWAKALSLKINSSFDGVQFSTDGVLLIAHGYSSSSYIVVFNVSTGNILSARSYSAGGNQNYNYLIRSMTVSSGASPMAYVLSNYNSGGSCTGQHLIKFDPLNFSSAPVWRNQTLGTTNCGHLGLVFGRTESLLYAFSWYNGLSTVSLLDIDGNSKWQYSTPDGDSTKSNTIKYKEIDAATDLVIATSEDSHINYNRIIHSTTPPYSINTVSSKTLRNPTQNTSYRLIGLFIIDQDKAVSLIYNGQDTYLAEINFSSAKISYQKAFPQMYNLRPVIFTSRTLYYAGSYHSFFYSDQTTTVRNLVNGHSQVYSSDMTTTSCYSMAPIEAYQQYTMTSPTTTINKISSPIYESSSVTFLEDTQAYTTVNIDQSKITQISSWCNQSPFTVNAVTQSKSTFNVYQGGSDQNLPITAFSATLKCGTFSTTWKYTGVDNSDGHSLVQATDLISVNSTTGAILVSSLKPVGTYTIKVIGTLPDLVTTTSEIFTLNLLKNTVPVFSSPLTEVTAPLMKSTNYPFPSITDPDIGATTSVSVVKDSATGSQPSFITFTTTTLTAYPKLMTEVKAYIMIVIITDAKDTKEYSFKLNVTNQPPITTTQFITPFTIDFGKTNTYNLPSSQDPEGLPYTTTINSGPSYVKLDSINKKLDINPSNCATDFAQSTVKIDLTDEQPSTTTYSIDLQVNNKAPTFSVSTPFPNQAVMTNTIAYYTILCSDPEGCPLNFQTSTVLPFVTLNGNQIKFSPDQTQNGTYTITVSCTDNQNASVNSALSLIVYQPPKFNGNVIQQIDLYASNPANYSLPIFSGISDEHINHSSTLPRYVTFSSPLYSFLPDRVSDLGNQTVQGSLCNTYSCISFTFNLNVTNYPPYLNGSISNVTMSRNSAISYFIPQAIDRERQNITFVAQEVSKNVLPAFVKFNNLTQEFLFEPTQLDLGSNYQIELVLNDTFGASQIYTFSITLFNPPSFKKSSQKLNESNSLSTQNSATLAAYLKMLKDQSEIQTQMLTLEILKVTRDQKASIKINGANIQKAAAQDLLVQITNKSFELVVQQQNISYRIEFQITAKDLANSIINLNLKYPKPSNLSLDSTDKLKLRTVQRFQKIKKQIQTIVPENLESEASIPKQIIITNLEAKLEQTIQGGRIAFTENTPTNMVIGFVIQMVWIQLLDISFLSTNSMLAITIPGIPLIIQTVMIKYIYFDIFYTEFWLSQFMFKIGIDFDLVNNDEALNQQFSENSFDSKFFLKNAGSSVLFLVAYIISWFIFSIVSILSRCSTRMNCLKEQIKKQLVWKQSLNFLMSQFPPLFLCSVLNFYDMRFKGDTSVAQFSTYLSVIVVASCSTALLLLFLKVWRLTRNLDQASVQEFNNSYSPLTDSLKETISQKLIFFWKPLILLRWAITLTILIAVQDKPSLQIIGLFILSVVYQGLILTSKPFNSRADNIISFCNEVAVSLYLYVAILSSAYLETQIEDNEELTESLRIVFGYILTSLLMLTIFVNLVYFLINMVIAGYKFMKNKCQQWKMRVAKYSLRQDFQNNQYQIQENSNQKSSLAVSKSTDLTRFEADNSVEPNQYPPVDPTVKNRKTILPLNVRKAAQIREMNYYNSNNQNSSYPVSKSTDVTKFENDSF